MHCTFSGRLRESVDFTTTGRYVAYSSLNMNRKEDTKNVCAKGSV